MTKTERYSNFDEVTQELTRLQHVRTKRREAVELYWDAIKDHDTRGRLLKDALHDAFRSIRPIQAISSLLTGNGSSTGARIAAHALTGRGSLKRRLFWAVLSAAAPALVGLAAREIGKFARRSEPDPNGEEIVDR